VPKQNLEQKSKAEILATNHSINLQNHCNKMQPSATNCFATTQTKQCFATEQNAIFFFEKKVCTSEIEKKNLQYVFATRT